MTTEPVAIPKTKPKTIPKALREFEAYYASRPDKTTGVSESIKAFTSTLPKKVTKSSPGIVEFRERVHKHYLEEKAKDPAHKYKDSMKACAKKKAP
jgi:hypothetical protein